VTADARQHCCERITADRGALPARERFEHAHRFGCARRRDGTRAAMRAVRRNRS
jgi:hypothetical protein